MPAIIPASVNEHLETVRSTAVRYFRGQVDQTLRGHTCLALMQKYGLVETGADPSIAYAWNARYSLPDVSPYGSAADITFETHVSQQQYNINNRGYRASDKWDYQDYLMNNGRSAIRRVFGEKSEMLATSMNRAISESFFTNGYDADHLLEFIGIPSCVGTDGATAAGDRIAIPDDNYGGLDTDLQAYGGSWSSALSAAQRFNQTLTTDWPLGKGRNEYDFNAPLLVNVTASGATGWVSGAKWSENCEEIMRFVLNNMRVRCGMRRQTRSPFIFLMGQTFYNEFISYFTARGRIPQPVQEAIDLGFPETVNFEGAWVTLGYEIPEREFYVICPDMIELFTIQSDLFQSHGPEFHQQLMAWLYLVTTFGNYRINPKYICHGSELA